MSGDHLQRLARGRMQYTGETYNQARSAVEQLRDTGLTIPPAHTETQRQLECSVMSMLTRATSLPIRMVRPFPDGLEVLFTNDTLDESCARLFRVLLWHGIAGGYTFTAKDGRAGVEILGAQASARLLLRKVQWTRFRAAIDGDTPDGAAPASVDPELSDLLRRALVLKTAEHLAWVVDHRRAIPADIVNLLTNPMHGIPSRQSGRTEAVARPAAQRRIFALLVGINHKGLTGCENDVEAVKAYLQSQYSDADLAISVLLGSAATREGIIVGLRNHLTQAGPRDTALFWFSGHGGQLRLAGTGLLATAIIPADFDESTRDDPRVMLGPELVALLNSVADRAAHVVAVVDACHAGGSVGSEPPTPISDLDSYKGFTIPLSTPLTDAADPARFVGLAATTSATLAYEYTNSEQVRHGVLTDRLLAVLKRLGSGATYSELMGALYVETLVPGQHPTLWPADPNLIYQPFLGGAVRRPATDFTMQFTNGQWTIDAGSCHGLTADTKFTVAGTSASQQVEIVGIRPGAVRVRPVNWQPEPGVKYQVDLSYNGRPITGVRVEGEGETAARIRVAIETAGPDGRSSPYLALDPDASLRVVADTNNVRIDHVTMRRTLAELPIGPRSVTQTLGMLERAARWQQLLYLDDPGGGLRNAVQLEIIRGNDELHHYGLDDPVQLCYHRSTAPKIRFRLRNTADRSLYCALITFTDAIGVHTSLLHGAWIAPGSTATAAYGREVELAPAPGHRPRRGERFSTWVKLIVAVEPFNVASFQLPHRLEGRGLDNTRAVSVPVPSISGTMLESRPLAAPEPLVWDTEAQSEWSTTTVQFEVRR